MRIMISIQHPSQVHQYKYFIEKMTKMGNKIKVVAIKKKVTIELLEKYNINYELISNSTGKGIFEKILILFTSTYKIYKINKKFNTDIFFARASPMIAFNSFLFKKPHIAFSDSEVAFFPLLICKLFSKVIFTPKAFTKNLGSKQLRIDTYKELFYLHPNWFSPDYEYIKKEFNNKKIILFRFVSWQAHHDIGKKGFSNEEKIQLVRELKKYGEIIISSEGKVPDSIRKYVRNLPIEKIHDILYNANLLITDSQTMTTEAAVLGTPVLRYNSFVGNNDMSNFVELEKKYCLIYNVNLFNEVIDISKKILLDPDIKKEWNIRKENMLNDKIDGTEFFINYISNNY